MVKKSADRWALLLRLLRDNILTYTNVVDFGSSNRTCLSIIRLLIWRNMKFRPYYTFAPIPLIYLMFSPYIVAIATPIFPLNDSHRQFARQGVEFGCIPGHAQAIQRCFELAFDQGDHVYTGGEQGPAGYYRPGALSRAPPQPAPTPPARCRCL